jgi:F0F1-type ATP synthase assembly protein I
MGDKGLMRAAVLASQLGFSVACPLAAFVIGGYWADGKFNTKPLFLLIGLFVGIIAAGAALYQVVQAQPAGQTRRAANAAPDKIERQSSGARPGPDGANRPNAGSDSDSDEEGEPWTS